jgi:hypothetical protein
MTMASHPRNTAAKVPAAPAVKAATQTEDATTRAFREIVKAADVTLELMCRLRGITFDDLRDDELNEFFLHALGEEFFLPPATE